LKEAPTPVKITKVFEYNKIVSSSKSKKFLKKFVMPDEGITVTQEKVRTPEVY
jgi:hypothetical protein